jgi:hypothetical protein
MARKVAGKGFVVYNVIEYFRGVEFKVHGPFEGEWQAQNFMDTRMPEDGVEYRVVEL